MSEPTPAGSGPPGAAAAPAPPPPAPATPAIAPAPLAPVAAGERVEILDVLRGFAIFGILVVNMALFFSPMHLQILNEPATTGPLDELAQKLILFLAQGKFYSLFSFLFGMGLAVQMERAAARGRKVGGFFAGRMFWLLMIGLLHAFLLWFGDILVLYSLTGFVLILFRNCKPKTLAIWTGILLAVPILLAAVQVLSFLAVERMAPAMLEPALQGMAEFQEELRAGAAAAYEAYSSGTWSDVFAARAGEWLLIFPFTLINFSWIVLALFVLGLRFGKLRFFHRLEDNLPAIRRAVGPLFAVGLVLNLLLVVLAERIEPMTPSLGALGFQALFVIAPPILSAAYVAAICLLWQRSFARRALSLLAPVGRMALSNYLLHTVVFTTIAYSYGFGLYGEISYLEGIGLTVAMFALQIPLSAWWLRTFRFGPLEWLWRSLSYRRLQPMRREARQPIG
jgi:uncharacterized protein